MPRLKKNITSAERRIQSSGRYYSRNNTTWIDPFPEVHGTLPEKMVYSALTQAGVPFYFLNDLAFSMPEIDFFKEYQVDFIIPSTKTIIEVQGSFWHSKSEVIESDSYKLAVYKAFGYNVLTWWDYEIQSNLANLLASAGILFPETTRYQLGKSTELTPIKRTKIDTSKGIRTMNARKRKPYRTFIGASKKTIRKVKSSYGTN